MNLEAIVRKWISKLWHSSLVQFFIPEKFYIAWEYRRHLGKKLNLKKPLTFNEKIQWLKLYDHNPLYTTLVDKFEARQYIAQVIGAKYLIPLIGVYETEDDIPFDELPEQYVLKCTHDCGSVIVKNNTCALTENEIKKKLKNALKRNYYYEHREWPYKNVKPRVICENYLGDPASGELIDYKFLCFNGEPKCLFICLDRNNGKGLKVDFYDLDWNLMPFERHYPNSGRSTPKPKCFDLMKHLVRKISKDFPFVRVDLYVINKEIYFGELTFYPGNGIEEFSPEIYDEVLGGWIQIPKG